MDGDDLYKFLHSRFHIDRKRNNNGNFQFVDIVLKLINKKI